MLGGSQGVVLATAMVVSSTVLFLAFSNKHRNLQSPSQNLRSCLYSEEKKKEKKKKNKRVKFAENVKDTKGNGEEYRREKEKYLFHKQIKEKQNSIISCRINIERMPANRVALYNGILRDRVHRMECSC